MVTEVGKNKSDIRKQAEQEITEERNRNNVARLKEKLRELDNAKVIVRNLEREVAAIESEINEGL